MSTHVLTLDVQRATCDFMEMARKKRMLTLTLDPPVVERLDAWLAKQEFPPARNAAIEAAIKAWLDEREG